MNINLTLNLPRDESTLPLVRHLTKYCLYEIGVDRDCVGDVELAITEACANVIEHTREDDQYEVHIAIEPNRCEIRVIDTGRGFDHEALGLDMTSETAEGGRGIQLMRALVDGIHFTSVPEAGTVVHLVKHLDFDVERPFVAAARARANADGQTA